MSDALSMPNFCTWPFHNRRHPPKAINHRIETQPFKAWVLREEDSPLAGMHMSGGLRRSA
jgi:hypothetical protein